VWSFDEIARRAKEMAGKAKKTALAGAEVLSDGLDAAADGLSELTNDLQREANIARHLRPENAELLMHPRGLTAVHESGHAVLSWRSPTVLKINSAELHEGGGTVWRQNTNIPTNVSYWYDIAICLAGIAAELELVTTFSPVASKKDLLLAAQTARQIIAGGHTLANCPWDDESSADTIDVGSVLKTRPANDVNDILRRCFQHARYIIRENRPGMLKLAKEILKRDKLTHDDIVAVLGPRPFNEKFIF